MAGQREALRNSRNDRFESGYSEGYRVGCRESVVRSCTPLPKVYWDLRILFVSQGLAVADLGIITGFQGMVREMIVVSLKDMLQTAAVSRPDLVLVRTTCKEFPDTYLAHIDAIRSLGIHTAVWFADDSIYMESALQMAFHYGYVFTHEWSCVMQYRQQGCEGVHYLPPAALNTVYKPQAIDHKYKSDICLIGDASPNRIELLHFALPFLTQKKVVLIGRSWDLLADPGRLAGSVRLNRALPSERAKYYNGAKVVVNVHRTASGQSPNPRTFEIAACGSFQLADARADLPSFYIPGMEIGTYSTHQEFVDKACYYLEDEHEQERVRMGLRGLRRTLQEHLYPSRLQLLLHIIFGRADGFALSEYLKWIPKGECGLLPGRQVFDDENSAKSLEPSHSLKTIADERQANECASEPANGSEEQQTSGIEDQEASG